MLEIIIVLIFIITKSNSFCKLIPTLNMNDLVILSCNSKCESPRFVNAKGTLIGKIIRINMPIDINLSTSKYLTFLIIH